MQAGIDFGSTLIKAVWEEDGALRYVSTADVSRPDLFRMMSKAGIRTAYRTGIGFPSVPSGLGIDVLGPSDDAVNAEIRLQAAGARELLIRSGAPLKWFDRFLLVSVGTGTSFTRVDYPIEVSRFPIGSALGGGFITNLGRVLGVSGAAQIEESASRGEVLDLLVKDIASESAFGNLPVAHFGKAKRPTRTPHARWKSDLTATMLHMVGCIVAGDAVKYAMAMGVDQVVFIGTTVARSPTLRKHLDRYVRFGGKTPTFLDQGEYAGALGAYLHVSKGSST